MRYIIDANNLAGKIGILFDDNFDKTLIEKLGSYFCEKKMEIVLVFDGTDNMGDKYREGNILVVRTPKDSYYTSADDMILETVESHFGESSEELTLVTDDRELIELAKEIKEIDDKKFFVKSSTNFAKKIQEKGEISEVAEGDDKELSSRTRDDINKELLDLWK